ncbi:GNAT family N-acetyltransferase [Arthrobacter sp. M4]|uniref:GNAT family N-acetyltransferase n=1 Tax=Arthrobacter sp. M4 TaxID=218160 RepID=UPI001CDC9DF3|nr:GNAT family N-acetyltransferase [Arthrobacter sp. M4]MCA4131343.1 GNAT family N-acetyltransferase [Arthrobacter sp. M4]
MTGLGGPGGFDVLMDHAWPAPDRYDTGAWVFRAAGGVTQRANSIWLREPAADPRQALREAAEWYRQRRLPVIFQVFDDPRQADLGRLLDEQRFTTQSETLILARHGGADSLPGEYTRAAANIGGSVELSEAPDDEWMQLWWSIDGRGGDYEKAVARLILTDCQAVYALVRDDDGEPAAVGRLALVGAWGGLYCMATRRERRRQGHGTTVLRALVDEGRLRGIEAYWLLVTAGNHGAKALYEAEGFRERGRYRYRQAPLRRALGGC